MRAPLHRRIRRALRHRVRHAPAPHDDGFALIITTLLLGTVLAFSVIMSDAALETHRAARTVERSIDATLIAEAGVHKALRCLKATSGTNCGGAFGSSYAGETGVAYGDGTFTVAVTGTGGQRTITSIGTTVSGYTSTVRTTTSSVAPSQAVPGFDFAVHASDLGVYLQNNAQVDGGTVRSDADITCSNNARIEHDVYVSRAGGKIDNCDGLLDAHADRILNSQVLGDAYYRNNPADISGTSVAGTKFANQATPSVASMPDFDASYWEGIAEDGGTISGNYSPSDGSSLGPVAIDGNLTLTNNVDVTVYGPIWVKGNVTLSNNSSMTLASGFGTASGVLVARDPDDANGGVIDLSNNATVSGSGTDGSYMLLYSASARSTDGSPAVRISNNVDGGIFYAPNGSIRVYNNGAVIAAVGRRVYLDNNAQVNYDATGATPSSMSVGTAAGGVWRFLDNTWLQFK